MKSLIFLSSLFFLLLSCTSESIAPTAPSPIREVHYNMSTGEMIGEKINEYDAAGRLVREDFNNIVNTLTSYEIIHEYNANGDVVKIKSRQPNLYQHFQIKEFVYSNGLKVAELEYQEGVTGIRREDFYYSGNSLPDSSRIVYIQDQESDYWQTSIYSYDAAGRLILKTNTNHTPFIDGRFVYTYDGDNLVSTCVGDNENAYCTVNTYNSDNQLTSISSQSPGISELHEERFYKGSTLDETRLYVYKPYQMTGDIDYVKQIKYEYQTED